MVFNISGTDCVSPQCDTPEDLEDWAKKIEIDYPTTAAIFYRFADAWKKDRDLCSRPKCSVGKRLKEQGAI